MISTYEEVISLSDAKVYLRIDDGQDETDHEIRVMRDTALSYCERYTNHILLTQDKTYIYTNYCVRVYDYPINTVTTTTATAEAKNLYTLYDDSNTSNTELALNVGYTNPSDIPSEIIDAAKVLMKHLYINHEEKEKRVPEMVNLILDPLRRFII